MAREPVPRRLGLGGFAALVVVYLVVIQVVGLALGGVAELDDGAYETVEQVAVHLWIPLGLALVVVWGAVAVLGWWRPVLHDDRPVPRWVWVVPALFLLAVVVATDYGALADHGLGFTLALLLATQLVGWGEEGMFRGIGVTVLRERGLTEPRVALWSSLIFGAVHLSNAVGRGAGAVPQAILVSLAGYAFYLTRRVSGGLAVGAVLHGLFDFALISATALGRDEVHPGVLAPILLYPVLATLLLTRRHHLDPDPDPEDTAGSDLS